MNPGLFEEPEGICKIASDFSKDLSTRPMAAFFFLMSTLFDVVPTVAYLLLNNPHDCFVCFGKDPDRNFSSFQLNLREKVYRDNE